MCVVNHTDDDDDRTITNIQHSPKFPIVLISSKMRVIVWADRRTQTPYTTHTA